MTENLKTKAQEFLDGCDGVVNVDDLAELLVKVQKMGREQVYFVAEKAAGHIEKSEPQIPATVAMAYILRELRGGCAEEYGHE